MKGNEVERRKRPTTMSRHDRAVSTARVWTHAGLAAAVVPFAILVHLGTEATCTAGRLDVPAFVVRHLYLAVVALASAIWFARTVGIGTPVAERRRRCALVRAHLPRAGASYSFCSLALANVSFFALSQLIEGVPIASGDACLGLAGAVAGSLLAAVFVVVFGRSIAIAALVAVARVVRDVSTPPRRGMSLHWSAPRRAATIFSLFVPNRPPPRSSLI